MKRFLACLVASAALLLVPAVVPAGPGDSEPSGPLPLGLIHCPSTNPAGNYEIPVWVHCHNMESGYTLALYNNNIAVVLKAHSVTQPWPETYPGTWDDYNLVDIAGLGYGPGTKIRWHADVLNTANGLHYHSYNQTIQQ